MFKKMNLSGLLLAGLMALFLSGCGEVNFEWGGRSSAGLLVTIVDDSLALLNTVRGWSQCEERFMGYSECINGNDNLGLFLVNYREKKPVLWGDTLDYTFSLSKGFYRDSSVFYYKGDGTFGFWKIGEKPRDVRKWKWQSPCSAFGEYSLRNARPWRDGNVLIRGVTGCPYSVLDTATGNISELTFDGENAWLAESECDDITYLDGKVVCLQPIFERKRYGVYLIEDNNMVDSLVWDNSFWEIKKQVLTISGNLFTLDHPSTLSNWEENPLSGKQVISVIPFLVLNPFVWLDVSSFRSDDSAEVTYFSEDLFVTK